jgi:hypothetical protein
MEVVVDRPLLNVLDVKAMNLPAFFVALAIVKG